MVSKCCKSAAWAWGTLLTAVGSVWGVAWMLRVPECIDMTGAGGRFSWSGSNGDSRPEVAPMWGCQLRWSVSAACPPHGCSHTALANGIVTSDFPAGDYVKLQRFMSLWVSMDSY